MLFSRNKHSYISAYVENMHLKYIFHFLISLCWACKVSKFAPTHECYKQSWCTSFAERQVRLCLVHKQLMKPDKHHSPQGWEMEVFHFAVQSHFQVTPLYSTALQKHLLLTFTLMEYTCPPWNNHLLVTMLHPAHTDWGACFTQVLPCVCDHYP
jgi:hypothetical protein